MLHNDQQQLKAEQTQLTAFALYSGPTVASSRLSVAKRPTRGRLAALRCSAAPSAAQPPAAPAAGGTTGPAGSSSGAGDEAEVAAVAAERADRRVRGRLTTGVPIAGLRGITSRSWGMLEQEQKQHVILKPTPHNEQRAI